MTLAARLRCWIDRRCLSAEHLARREQLQRESERISRERDYIAARLEAVQAQISGNVRARLKLFAHPTPADLIPFPWRLTR